MVIFGRRGGSRRPGWAEGKCPDGKGDDVAWVRW